jgi:hypothetical protein
MKTRVAPDHILRLPDELPVNALIRLHIQKLGEEESLKTSGLHTKLDKRLSRLRQAYLASGGRLLSPEEQDEELCQRRGGLVNDYSQWHQQLDQDLSIREISDRAMALRMAK